MRTFLLRLFIVFLIIFIQTGFLNLFFLNNYFVNLSILLVISWVIVSGFEKTWLWILWLGFLNDIFLGSRIGPNILLFISLAYIISFTSRRFIIERRFSGFLLVVVFIAGGLFLGNIFDFIFRDNFIFSEIGLCVRNYFIDWKNFIFNSVVSGICFYFIYSLVNKIEKYIARQEGKLRLS